MNASPRVYLLEMLHPLFSNHGMKYVFPKLLFLVLFVGFLFQLGCGQDSGKGPAESSDDGDGKTGQATGGGESASSVKPSAPIRSDDSPPTTNWIGNGGFYQASFEERFEVVEVEKTIKVLIALPSVDGVDGPASREEDQLVKEPVDMLRLYVRSTGEPYTGSIIRTFTSGEPEYHAKFEDGFRMGIAYEWDKEGKLTKAMKGWGGNNEVDLDLSITADPLAKVLQQLSGRAVDPEEPIFRGTLDTFQDWNDYDSEDRLLNGESGEIVSGKVRLYGSDGKIEAESNYVDGKKHGIENVYHPNGVQSMKVLYAQGVKTGTETWWNANGLKSYEANFVNGQLNGIETIWNESGAIISQQRLDNGKVVEVLVEQP